MAGKRSKPARPEKPPKEAPQRSTSFRAAIYALVALACLVPCFWQSRIQAGDLSSHIYNAWLAKVVASQPTPGLVVRSQTTNVLFDLMLSSLLGPAGAEG